MLKYTYRYILVKKYLYFMYLFMTFCNALISIYIPLITSGIIDKLIDKNLAGFQYSCVAFAGLSVASIVLTLICSKIFIIIETRAAFDINFECIKRLQKAEKNIDINKSSTYMTQRINNDSNAIALFSINLFNSVIVNFIYILISWLILWSKSYELTVILSIFAFIDILLYIVLRNYMRNINSTYKESQAKFFSDLNIQLDLCHFIQTHSLYHWFWNRLVSGYNKFYSKILKFQMFSKFYEAANLLITVLAQSVTFILGGIFVMKNILTIGEFVLIMTYFNMLISALKYFSNLGKEYQEAKVSYLRIQDILKYKKRNNGCESIKKINKISLDNISFGYNNEHYILTDFSYVFEKGYIYGIKGSNGIGKSTLLYLIAGILNPLKGAIFYNDNNLKEYDIENILHSHVSIIDQNICILNDTIKVNILMDDESKLTKANLIAKELFRNNELLEKRFLANITADSLSGGEKQKITIMREMSKNFDLLIADEPTSSLDIESKENFGALMQNIKSDKIIIIITHDKCLEKYFDYTIDLSA